MLFRFALVLSLGLFLVGACGKEEEDAFTPRSLDFAVVAKALADLEAFSFEGELTLDLGLTGASASLGNFKHDGVFVAPDRFEWNYTTGSYDFHLVYMGAESWRRDFSGIEWRYSKGEAPNGEAAAATALFSLPKVGQITGEARRESLGGVRVTHYSFDKESLQDLVHQICCATAQGFLYEGGSRLEEIAEAQLDVWVNDKNVPLKMAASASGRKRGTNESIVLELKIADVNAKSLAIKAPAPTPTALGGRGTRSGGRPGQYRDAPVPFGEPATLENWRILVVGVDPETRPSRLALKAGESRLVVRIRLENLDSQQKAMSVDGHFRLAGIKSDLASDLYAPDRSGGLVGPGQCGGTLTRPLAVNGQLDVDACFFVPSNSSTSDFQLVWWPSFGRDSDLTFFALR